MAPALYLLGPPELHHHPKEPPTTPLSTYEDLPLLKDLKSSLPPLNPHLEFFFKAVAHTETPLETPQYGYWWSPLKPKDLTDYEEEAWKIDSLTALKTLLCLRMMKNPNKEAFYKCLLWVHKNHPKTLALNVMVFVELGWFEDLLEILRRVLKDSIHKLANPEKKSRRFGGWGNDDDDDDEKKTKAAANIPPTDDTAKAKIAVERYQNDSDYRFLHNRISDLFVDVLKSDLRFLTSGAIKSVSSASKICSAYDSETLICEIIAKKMFPRSNHIEYKSVKEPYYTYMVRDRLRDEVLFPLRKATGQVKKPSIETGKALLALETYRKMFKPEGKEEDGSIVLFHHCMELIKLFSPKVNMVDMLGNLSIEDGEEKLPHQIVASLFEKKKWRGRYSGEADEAADLEWRGLVQEFANHGKLRNCVAVCDVMRSTQAFNEAACLSMGLLISELSEHPWKGKIFSFNELPKLLKVEGDDLRSKCEFMRQMESTEKVNFGAIYNRILQIAITEKLKKEQMPKRIFVFTYSDFVTASKNNWQQEYKEAWAGYRKRGFSTVPHLVFWNLKDPVAEPEVFGSPVKNQNGGMIMTGFSNLLLKMFFRGETDPNAGLNNSYYRGVNALSVMKFVPRVEDVMNCAISREELKNLVVLD